MNFTTAEKIFSQTGNGRNGLPAWTFNNEELNQLEIERIFLRNWFWVGHVSDIPNPGDYKCQDLANERAVVIKGEDGEVRAFHNLCRHRGSRVVGEETGNCKKAIVCPFHGWSYHLDGGLRSIPHAKTFPDIDKSQYGLKPVDCEVWHGLIFIRFQGDGASVAETFAEAEEEISLYNLADMKPYDEPWHYDFDLDWKAVLDIDNEGYHVPIGHPGLFDLFGSSYQDQVLESGIKRSHGYLKDYPCKTPLVQNYIDTLPAQSYLPESHQRIWIYWSAFPGFVITLMPDMIEVYQTYSLGYQKSIMAGACYALADDRVAMQKTREFNREINQVVGDEDIKLVKWSDQGMRSSVYESALLSDLELGIAAFQNQLRRVLPVVTLAQPPEAGKLASKNTELESTL
ncbi:MAG: aromatic ring-hydroxylating dioxygenase subunit alpha [Gammaproteobacteria bacterium]|nr:aromatic ring-hydroxylating dioxygenase subunit alpha [Gammaproteobacteria bacterium]